MSEGIEYHELGTIDITFDEKTYHLGRPKTKHWRYFTRKMDRVTTDAQDGLAALVKRLAEAQQAILAGADAELRGTYELADQKATAEGATNAEVRAREVAWEHIKEAADPELIEAHAAVEAEISVYAENPFFYRSAEVVKEMFTQLGDPLPDDIDEWPAWLATDVKLPGAILAHWRTHPKASGPNGQM